MLFSCKISNSIISFLEAQGEDLSLLLENTSLPLEFASDPSYWMQAAEMESFLQTAQRLFLAKEPVLLQTVGHQVAELRSWGIFDSVLRMLPHPQEILAQPQRFLSYFISPPPPVENIVRTSGGVSFDLPISSEQYPLVTTFLRAGFESLPVFVGQPLGECQWQGIRLNISWPNHQSMIFSTEDVGHSISPDLLRNIVASLEQSQRELQQKNSELQTKNELLGRHHEGGMSSENLRSLRQNVAKLSDYMARAQQLVTILTSGRKLEPGIKEAMRRVDWQIVLEQFPQMVEDCQGIFRQQLERNLDAPHSHN